jgi:hypothetical protein
MDEEDDDDFRTMRLKAAEGFAKIREWALSEELPTGTYNPKHGWTLDQLAKNLEPKLLIALKEGLRDYHQGERDEPEVFLRLQHLTREIESKIQQSLLEDRYHVTGFALGSNRLESIPNALLVDMHPNIILSELRELTVVSPRRFEKVRVFDQKRSTKGAAGVKPTYNWPALKAQLEDRQPDIFTLPALVNYCRENVKSYPGKRGSLEGPDDKTIREAIVTYGLAKFIKALP